MAVAAETSFATEVSTGLLICSICQSQFQKPRVLSCQHSFCAKCLKGWLQTRNRKTSVLKCAVCREITVLPSGGVDHLPENYALKGLISMLKSREKQQAGNAGAEKITPKKTTPAKRNSVKANVGKKGPKSGEDVAKVVAEKVKKQDENANVRRDGKKKSSANAKKNVEPIVEASSSEYSDSSEEYSDDSSMSDSDDSSEQSSSGDDDVSTSGSESDVPTSGSESDVPPPTPTLKLYGEVKVGMEVYVFNSRGKKFPGHVKLLEECKVAGSAPTRIYAGIELTRENSNILTADLDLLENSYLSYWICEYENPCTVVRADHCIPVTVVEQLLSQT